MSFTGEFDIRRIEKEIEDFLFRRGYELVDIRFDFNPVRPLLEVFADRVTGGITVKDLSEINGRLQLFLEAGEFFPDRFQLVVSSPGLDRVIKKEEDFKKYLGRRVKITTASSAEKNSKSREVTLIGFENDEVIVEMSDKTIEKYLLKELKKVRLVPDIDFGIDSNKNGKKRKKD